MENIDPIVVRNLSSGPRLRVALVTETFPPEVNGVAMTLGRMVDGLLARGHTVQLVRPRQGANDHAAQEQTFEETLAHGAPIPGYGGLRFGLPAKMRLTRLWQSARPDLVHVATEGPLGWSAVAAAQKLKLPVTSSFHTNFDRYSRHYGIGWLKRPVAGYLRKFHNRTAATFVPTEAMARDLGEQGYLNLQVLARGVDRQLFAPTRRSPELRASWDAGDDDLVVLSVGRIAPEKNLQLVERAFAAIRTVQPNARLVLVGDGPARHALENSHPDYRFAGMRTGTDLATHYASGDLFLFPSLTETFGNVTLEAMSSGLTVVAYHCAAAGDVIHHGESGLLAPPEDELRFIDLAVQAASDDELRGRLGHGARDGVEGIDWDAIHERLENAFLRIIRQHRRRQPPEDCFLQILPD